MPSNAELDFERLQNEHDEAEADRAEDERCAWRSQASDERSSTEAERRDERLPMPFTQEAA
jgi:hypothetical protein